MLQAKFQDHRTSGSGEDYLRFLSYMGLEANFRSAPGPGQTTPWSQFLSLTVLFSQYSPLLQFFLH